MNPPAAPPWPTGSPTPTTPSPGAPSSTASGTTTSAAESSTPPTTSAKWAAAPATPSSSTGSPPPPATLGHPSNAPPNAVGKMGGRPSHPELLDWLAADFRDSGGSLKRLHRLIVTSDAYRQSSA